MTKKRQIKDIRQDFDTLFLIFLVLKATTLITWSWWWVSSPLLIRILLPLFQRVLKDIIWAFSKNDNQKDK